VKQSAARRAAWLVVVSFVCAFAAYFTDMREAKAVPSFARKYQTSCLTCHTVYPALNPFGEAFRRNGYRFPSQNGSVDSDAVKTAMVPLGQEEYKKSFPNSVWPAAIPEAVPLSVMMNGSVAVNLPNSDAHDAAGNVFGWNGIVGELHLFAAGAFNDSLTYFTQLTIPTDDAIDVETAYVLWNDIVGPSHYVNLWVGRLMNPQISSFGLHGSYIADNLPAGVSVAGLFNPSGSFILGQGHTDGAEANGIIGHRFAWSLGWIASTTATDLKAPNAEDAYVHIGVKTGGVALDGEGKYGPNAPDPQKPWAEKAITLDAFAYHGMNVLDNGTGTVVGGATAALPQRDSINAVGGSLRAQLDSAILTTGAQLEIHARPYQGTAATANPNGDPFPGVPEFTNGKTFVQYGELDYVVYPWFVPGVRTEFTRTTTLSSNPASLLRVIPGIAMLVRPDIKVVVTGEIERAYGLPTTGSWDPAGGSIVAPGPGQSSKFEAESINTTVAVAF
jgi:hypothetical protein